VPRQYLTKKARQLKRTANHIRDGLGAEDELRQLGRSYLTRPLQPIICRPDLEVLDGNRRLQGVLLEGGPDTEVPVCITDEPMSDAVKLEIQMESAIHTRGLSAYEQFLGARKWLELNPGATAEQLAERIGRSGSMMTRILSLERCLPAVKEAAAAGLIGVSEWYEFAKCSEQQQHELLAAKLSGAVKSRSELARAGRRQRNGQSPAVRVNRIKIELSSGATVTIAGAELSLEDAIEATADAQKRLRQGRDQGLTAKTISKVSAERAKAGGSRD
jgi:ParB family transcriptional regulator, chromosome partitioning protein